MTGRTARWLFLFLLTTGPEALAFERVECMDHPEGSVYIFKRVPGSDTGLDVRIYHGWQFARHSLPGIPIGIEEDFINARYQTRTAEARERAIAAFSPLERLIFNMDVVFHHEFSGCDLSGTRVRCREERPLKVGREWISQTEFFFDARFVDGIDARMVYTVGIRGQSADTGLKFSSGRRYVNFDGIEQCLYLRESDWRTEQ